MEPEIGSRGRRVGLALTRRALLAGAAASGAAALAGWPRGAPRAAAQGSANTLTVGYAAGSATLDQVIADAVKATEAAHPGVKVDVKKLPSANYETQLFLALNSGAAPDVFLLSGLGIAELSAGKFLEPLDAYLQGWDGWPQFGQTAREAITYQGKVWAIPYVLDTHFLYYRRDTLQKAGLPADWQPKTPDDVLAAAREVKAKTGIAIPYGLYAGANGGNSTAVRGFLPLVRAYGGTLFDQHGKWIIDSCPIEAALAYYETAYQTDKTVPQQAMTAASPTTTLRTAIMTGDLGLLYDGSWAYGSWTKANAQIASEQIGYSLFPSAHGDPFTIGAIGNSWYLNAKAADKALAWSFIAAANTKEAQVKLNVDDPHIPPRSDAAADPAFQASPFLAAMVKSLSALVIAAPDPSYRQLIGVIQNATGIVATGEAKPADAAKRYAEEMTRILGAGNVVSQPCTG